MAKKKGRPKKTKLQKDLDRISKTALAERFSEKAVKAALEAGFVEQQIGKFKDEESLRLAVISHKPGLAKRFIEIKPLPEKKEIEYVEIECEFDVSVSCGPLSDHLRKEGQEIVRMARRKGIPAFDILSISTESNMVAENGRKHSKVIIKYRKGT